MTTQTSKTTCWIPKCHLPALREKVEKLDRKAKKLGMQPFEISVLEEAVKPWTHETVDLEDRMSYIREEKILAVKVAITGEPPEDRRVSHAGADRHGSGASRSGHSPGLGLQPAPRAVSLR